jgi:hypothetical protein
MIMGAFEVGADSAVARQPRGVGGEHGIFGGSLIIAGVETSERRAEA